ncbi:thioesterase II family protein [Kitasatospora sp. NPDC048239]|uniref:thioesterase II family protein n=1 Tax=Kitasatospora sp. NPDC048239 TaxID=3364046 RepID=UPI003711262E
MYSRGGEPTGRWFRTVRPISNPKIRLVCFAHAGGAASFFRSWDGLVPDGVEIVAVRYPGREDRLLDPPVETMAELVEPLVRECSLFSDAPLVFFGHSMGASVAHEVAVRLQAECGVTLSALAVSGRAGPGREAPRGLADASDLQLIEDVGLLGGTAAGTFEHADLRELILPAIRADYRLIERYRAPGAENAMVDAPVYAYYGSQDAELSEDSMESWSAVTRVGFAARAFDGGHFYLVEHAEAVLRDLFLRIDSAIRV